MCAYFILHVRSVIHTIDYHYRDWFLWLLTYLDHMTAVYGKMFYKTWSYFSKGNFSLHGKQRYTEHYDEVRKLVPPEQLLVYSVTEGWEPLCVFLGLPIPDSSFPSGNDQISFWKATRAWNRARAAAALSKALRVILLAAILLLPLLIGRHLILYHHTTA